MPRKPKARAKHPGGRPALPDALSKALQLRVSREQLARYQAAASAASVTLPEWVRSTLDAVTGNKIDGGRSN